jgi:hypothetical protein
LGGGDLMAIPAKIRVNAQLPFPSLVYGSGPITIGKQNGIWTVGFSIAAFASIVPPAIDYPIDYFLGYNANTNSFFKMSITNLVSALNTTGGAVRNQRSVTASPIIVSSTDQILNCKIATPATSALPLASSRAGLSLTYKNLTANHITISASDLIDGSSSFTIINKYQSVTFVPFMDGDNSGWGVE